MSFLTTSPIKRLIQDLTALHGILLAARQFLGVLLCGWDMFWILWQQKWASELRVRYVLIAYVYGSKE